MNLDYHLQILGKVVLVVEGTVVLMTLLQKMVLTELVEVEDVWNIMQLHLMEVLLVQSVVEVLVSFLLLIQLNIFLITLCNSTQSCTFGITH